MAPVPQAMPSELPAASPLIVKMPSATLTADGVRLPLPSWPSPLLRPHRPRAPVTSWDGVGAPHPFTCAAVGAVPAAKAGIGSGNRMLTTNAAAAAVTAAT